MRSAWCSDIWRALQWRFVEAAGVPAVSTNWCAGVDIVGQSRVDGGIRARRFVEAAGVPAVSTNWCAGVDRWAARVAMLSGHDLYREPGSLFGRVEDEAGEPVSSSTWARR